ncbi:MAG TPA: HNH endonuclease signature motif containing protein [Gemmatimonadales bacterium]|nr:HNH endonuclease signature motif containing protein [Gemmatimonadales bacterium]
MHTKPLRPCLAPRCPELVADGYCAEHRRVRERRRGSSAKRGYDARHRRWRLLVLARDPICKGCNRTLSTDADHIVPLSKGGTWELSNAQGLCRACHATKTFREARA